MATPSSPTTGGGNVLTKFVEKTVTVIGGSSVSLQPITAVADPSSAIGPHGTPVASPAVPTAVTATSPVPLHPDDPQLVPVADRKVVLALMCVLKIATSYDSGAYSFTIGADDGIADTLSLNSTEQGILGACVFLGSTCGCAIAAAWFDKWPAKRLLVLSMMGHAAATACFGLVPHFFLAVLVRLCIGFSLAFMIVYSVVWADLFSPPGSATVWLALLNIGVPVGTLFGFIGGGLMMSVFETSWRFTFFLKAGAMVPLILWLMRCKDKAINEPRNIHNDGEASPGSPGSETDLVAVDTNAPHPAVPRAAVPAPDAAAATAAASSTASPKAPTRRSASGGWNLKTWQGFLNNDVLVLNVAGLTVLFFVISALQNFFTAYLREDPFYASSGTIMICFGVTAVTAPIVGVVVGGSVMDKLGANYRDNPVGAAKMLTYFAAAAATCGLLTAWATTLAVLVVPLWFMLFCGAAALPAATGFIVSSVVPEEKAASSSFSNVMFNIFGQFAGPLFVGAVASGTNSIGTAMTVALNVGWLGAIIFFFAARATERVVNENMALCGRATVSPSVVQEALAANAAAAGGGDGGGSAVASPARPLP